MATSNPTSGRGSPGKFGVGALAIAIVASLAVWEGDKKVPYYDQVGVLTVCRGVTGPEVIKGKTYTDAECNALEQAYLRKMLDGLGRCVATPISFDEWAAYGHFSYNVGTRAFCQSTLVKKLNAGDRRGACREMGRWTFIRKGGVMVNCRDPKHKCGGLPKRRDYEVDMCLEGVDREP